MDKLNSKQNFPLVPTRLYARAIRTQVSKLPSLTSEVPIHLNLKTFPISFNSPNGKCSGYPTITN